LERRGGFVFCSFNLGEKKEKERGNDLHLDHGKKKKESSSKPSAEKKKRIGGGQGKVSYQTKKERIPNNQTFKGRKSSFTPFS